MSQLTIQISDSKTNAVLHTFYGICKSVVPTVGSDGRSTFQEFVDSREFLQWDKVYCAFNKREDKLVNGRFLKRYWHILPGDFNSQFKTYTNGPFAAFEILNYMFGSQTIESPWVRSYHPALNFPVYDVDCLSGKSLGTAITEISEALGTVFTLMNGRYRLVWTMKGTGDPPSFPANSDNRRSGTALSGNPTRIRILGDRDLYHVLNVRMEPDWLAGWQQFYDLDYLADDLFRNESTEADIGNISVGTPYNDIPDDPGNLKGRYLAAARARMITVGQYANLRDARDNNGALFRDFRKFGGRSRLQMPAALYIQSVLFRAYRPPANFLLRNAYGYWLNLFALELTERALVEVTHNPATGAMSWEVDVVSAGNGYAIVKGYQVGQDGYKTLRPEHFQINEWVNAQDTWQHLSFQVDDSGEGTKFIIFDAPVLRTGDLIKQAVIDGSTQKYPVLNAAPTFTAPPVQAALVFAAEPFSYVAGIGTRDEVENISGLNAEFVTYADGRGPTELPYADGFTATEKASAIAASLLNGQFTYDYGGYVVQGINGTQLSPVIDRVTVRWSKSGAVEEVDFTTERDRNVVAVGPNSYALQVPPERDFERRAQLLQLLPGQRELKEEARQLRLIAASLQQNPRLARTILEAFALAFGLDAMPASVYIDPAFEYSVTLPAGTPMYREADSQLSLAHGDAVEPLNPVFQGVTVFDGEKSDGPVRVTATGDNGTIFVRVKGPVKLNDSVGLGDSVQTYLETGNHVSLAVGNVLEEITGAETRLVPVRVTGAGGSGGEVLPVWL